MTDDGCWDRVVGGVLVLGGSGMLGSALLAAAPDGVAVSAPTHAALDVTDAAAVDAYVDAFARGGGAWIVNCAAYTAVDLAESHEADARRLNADAPAFLGAAAARRGLRVLHVSTDYVFGGEGTRPWREDDAVAPLSVYGRTKLEGERRLQSSGAAALIVRTAWLYGETGKSFPRTMWERARQGLASRVVADQHGAPTNARDLARWCWALMARDARGVVHASNAGQCTWADVAERVYAAAGAPGLVTRVGSEEYPVPAPRPRYSVLDGSRLESLLGAPRRRWDEALDEFLGGLDVRSAA
ncbi:MAG TPA: dTDP-4-dehydrorhamnose reductase [Gemmatimonadaceae bacterium]|nr:dTDP-4-dehydrorhamnose reductase [Gemmatimonadaceae bacterium]